MDKKRVEIIVYGRVQGVFFRDFTLRKAEEFGITGWVKNLDDGSVQIVAEGKHKDLEKLISAVKIGPPYAKVKDIKIDWQDYIGEFTDFQIRY